MGVPAGDRGGQRGAWHSLCSPAPSPTSPQAVLAGAVAFIYEKRGGIYWVSLEDRGWHQAQKLEATPNLLPPSPVFLGLDSRRDWISRVSGLPSPGPAEDPAGPGSLLHSLRRHHHWEYLFL